jgi:uncharacterized membrane protein YcfT
VHQRIAWADLARALAVVLVVLYHAGGAWIHTVVEDVGEFGRLVGVMNSMLLTVRMPLFFLVSGLLAARALDRPWSQVYRGRVLDLIWPFAIWTAAFAPFWAFAHGRGWADVPTALGWIVELSGAYWYLSALVVFFVVTWLARRHRPALLVVAAGVWLAAPVIHGLVAGLPGQLTVFRLATFFVWFVLGATFTVALDRLANAPLLIGVALGLAWFVATFLDRRADWSATPLLNVLGVAAAVVLCGWAARIPRVQPIARYLGGRTLAIYLVHQIALVLLVLALPPIQGGNGMSAALIIGATVLCTIGPALLHPHLPSWSVRFPFRRRASAGPAEAAAARAPRLEDSVDRVPHGDDDRGGHHEHREDAARHDALGPAEFIEQLRVEQLPRRGEPDERSGECGVQGDVDRGEPAVPVAVAVQEHREHDLEGEDRDEVRQPERPQPGIQHGSRLAAGERHGEVLPHQEHDREHEERDRRDQVDA